MKLNMRLIALLPVCALTLWGQAAANKAQLFGTVLDPKGAVVPGASIKVRNVATGFQRELTTGGEGQYRAVQLDAGTYEVVGQSSGFAATTVTGVELTVGSSVNVDITLQVQATSQVIEVAETMVSADMPSPSVVIGTTAMTNLPINGRRFHDFATLTPTVQVEPSRGQISFAGQRAINSNIMVDGADYNQPFFGGIRGGERSGSIITVPQSSIQEFQAIATGYSAEYGRSTGGVLNVISKSGTNELHGQAFYQNRNAELSANGPIPVPDLSKPGTLHNVQPAETLQQWGGAVGGPIRKDKLFFFVAYEQQRAVQPRQVVFSSLVSFTPTAANKPAYDFYKSLEQKFNKVNNAGAGTVKGDYTFNNGSRLTLRYNRSGSEEANAVTVGGAIEAFTTNALSNEGTEIDRLHFGSAQYTAILSPSIINDLRFSGSSEQRPRLSNSQQPGVTVSALGYFGTRDFMPNAQNDSRYQITDSLSLIRGPHTFKVGFDYNRLSAAQTFGFDQFGTFVIGTSNIAQVLDILSGAGSASNKFDSTVVSYRRQIGNLSSDYRATQAAIFAQDSWRVTRKLTLDFGLRWEGQYNPEVSSTNTTLVSQVNGLTYPNGARADVTQIPDATKQFMPRAGFAWNPLSSGRVVFRGHAGIFYASTPLLLFSDPTANFRNPPNNVRLTLTSTSNGTIYQQFKAAGVDLNASTLDKLPIIPLETVQRAAAIGLGAAPNPFLGAGTTAIATDYANPRSVQGGFGTELRVTGNWTAGVQFNYINTVHLERNKDYNLPLPTTQANDASGRPYFGIANPKVRQRPIDTLGQINIRESSSRSMYRGATFSTQYRARKLQGGIFYTVSEAFSDDDNERSSGGQAAMNSFNYRQDYGYAAIDARHQFASYAVYELPLGFEVSGLFRVRSGLPLNPSTGADTNGDSYFTDRPLQAVGVPFDRNSFRNRAVYANDLRVMKNFLLGSESRRLQLSAEFFNLFNADNVVFGGTTSTYGLGIDSRGASAPIDSRFMVLKTSDGRYSTQNSQVGFPFQVQFGARFFF